MSNLAMMMGLGSGAGGVAVADVFSTTLYTGTSAEQTITNGIDLAGEGGLVWTKGRNNTNYHYLIDTERGAGKFLFSNDTSAQAENIASISSFNSDGYVLGNLGGLNGSPDNYVSWTWRKAPRFFDCVTYTGTGSAQTISHNLGSVPGCIIVKCTSNARDWYVYHRGSNGGTNPEQYKLNLNSTAAAATEADAWNNTAPTSSVFTVGSVSNVNASGFTYVAYLFAHNDGDGEFGPDGDADIIKCASYTCAPTGIVDLGFEPQWIMIKRASGTGDWVVFDAMRGLVVGDRDAYVYANTLGAEVSNTRLNITPTGFSTDTTDSRISSNGETYIYIAIRRGPMAVPESATDVFAVATGNSGANPDLTSGFPVDFAILRENFSASQNPLAGSRLQGANRLKTPTTDAEAAESAFQWDFMDGWFDGSALDSGDISWMWKRAPNYFDVVAYTGNNTAGNTISHNLGVVPEMMWIKSRSNAVNWIVYHKDLNGSTNPEDYYLRLNGTSAETNDSSGDFFNSTAPTATNFTLGGSYWVNGTSNIAYLFASLDGVSKVGSYAGDSTTGRVIDCGFSSGARFVLIKRTDGAGDWAVWDSERGIVAGNDSRLRLNSTAAEVTGYDILDPHSSGFIVNHTAALAANESGQSYIFYAIA